MLSQTEREYLRRFANMIAVVERAMFEATDIWEEFAKATSRDRADEILGREYPRRMPSLDEAAMEVAGWHDSLEELLGEGG